MSFLLQDLESALPRDIVEKGLNYFAAEYVANVARQGNTWAADVHGTKTYTVKTTIKSREVLSWACDCPYDRGPVCKHVAAVLFAIRSEAAEAELKKMTASAKGSEKNKI